MQHTVARARFALENGRSPIVSVARTLIDLVRRSCYGMLRRCWQAGLQPEVARRIATATRKVALVHSATLVLCGIAAGGC